MSAQALINDLKSRINPAYPNQLGTESYERRQCVEALEKLLAENARLSALADRWNAECDAMREDNKRLSAELAAAHTVQDGYALVPIEPTMEMLRAGREAVLAKAFGMSDEELTAQPWATESARYRAILAAAPQPSARVSLTGKSTPENFVQEWRPIDTAPEGVDLILAGTMDHDTDWRIKTGHRCAERHNGWRIYGASWEPLLWMPLPAKPGQAPPAPDANQAATIAELNAQLDLIAGAGDAALWPINWEHRSKRELARMIVILNIALAKRYGAARRVT